MQRYFRFVVVAMGEL